MDDVEHTWTILHRRDWGHRHDSLIPEGAPVPEPDDDLAVIEVVPASQLRGAVEENKALRSLLKQTLPQIKPEPQNVELVRRVKEKVGLSTAGGR